MKKLLIISLFSLFLLASEHAYAQEANNNQDQSGDRIHSILSVSPAILDINLKKGSKQIYTIKVKNLLNEPLGIKANIGNFSPSDEESDINFSGKSKLMDMSKLSADSFIIQSGETKSFDLTLNTPKDLKDGGYYEAILLVPNYLKTQNPGSPTVLTQVGILVFGNSGQINYKDLASKVKILDLGLKSNTKQQLQTNLRVENLYFNHFTAKPYLTITPLFRNSQKIELTEKKILPGKIRRWDELVNLNQRSFIYKADLALSVGQGNYVHKTTYFTLLPIKNVILVIILILFSIFIFVRRIQIRKAIKVIISDK